MPAPSFNMTRGDDPRKDIHGTQETLRECMLNYLEGEK